MIVIVDYGLCNLDSITRAIEECGGDAFTTDNPDDIATADKIIVPGVGSFNKAMENLTSAGNDEAIRNRVTAGVPLLGICLGMQLLASRGAEAGESEGLGLLDATVEKLKPHTNTERVPHIGWNELRRVRADPLFDSAPADRDFYFVHSYHLCCNDPEDVVATTPYCGGFVSCVNHGNVWGAQFHPEKSQKAGFALLARFVEL